MNFVSATLHTASTPSGDIKPVHYIVHLVNDKVNYARAIFLPFAWLGRSGALANNTERVTKQREGKFCENPIPRGPKGSNVIRRRLIPSDDLETDQGRHGQRFCLAVSSNANDEIPARDVEYSLGLSRLSSVNILPFVGSLVSRTGEKQDSCVKNMEYH